MKNLCPVCGGRGSILDSKRKGGPIGIDGQNGEGEGYVPCFSCVGRGFVESRPIIIREDRATVRLQLIALSVLAIFSGAHSLLGVAFWLIGGMTYWFTLPFFVQSFLVLLAALIGIFNPSLRLRAFRTADILCGTLLFTYCFAGIEWPKRGYGELCEICELAPVWSFVIGFSILVALGISIGLWVAVSKSEE